MARFIKSATCALMLTNVAMYVLFVAAMALAGAGAASWFGFDWSNPKIWTPLTCIFTQTSPLELLFNMLWLWCFSRLFLEVATGRRMVVAYLVGGLCGVAMFVVGAAVGLAGGTLFGASAAVLGIICCAGSLAPRMRVNLMFFGAVEMRWIAVVSAAISLISFASGNVGGALAHAGGCLGGLAVGLRYRRLRISRRSLIKPEEATTLDQLLDKVRRSGYSSLSPTERQRLFDISKKL